MNDSHAIYSNLSSMSSLSQDPIWLTSTLSLFRNISNFKFLDLLEAKQKTDIVDVFSNAFQKLPDIKHLVLQKASSLSPITREFVTEKFFFSWPIENIQDHSFAFDPLQGLFIGINFSDHLFLHVIDSSQDIESSWRKLITLDKDIHQQVNYAFSEEFGYLTVNPGQCGTAFILSAYLHTPAIFWHKTLYDFLDEDNIKCCGLGNHTKEFLGDILILKNTKTLGVSEENILSSLRIWCHKVIGLENKLRKSLVHQENKKLKDAVMRSLGLLTHSFEISLEESLKAVSLIKLGIDLNIITPRQINLNEIILNLHRGHLLFSSNNHEKTLSPEEILILRSATLKMFASQLSLS